MNFIFASLVFVFLLSGCVSRSTSTSTAELATAEVTTSAPTLETVVVLNDPTKDEYNPSLFYVRDGKVRKLAKDNSCQKIMVINNGKRKTIECVSATNEMIPVGSVTDRQLAQQNDQVAYAVRWAKNVQVVETKTSRGPSYNLQIK